MPGKSFDPAIFDRDDLSPITGEPFIVLDCREEFFPDAMPDNVVIGMDREGALPAIDESQFDILLTSAGNAPRPWVSCDDIDAALDQLTVAIRAAPIASSILVDILRMNGKLSTKDALIAESLAYSTLLGGREFAVWLERQDAVVEEDLSGNMLAIERSGSTISITLDHPESRNAISAEMRDALYDIFVNALDDPTGPEIRIAGNGKCFSVGGYLPEFGSASDPAEAHRIRSQRSLAWLLYLMRDRAEVRFHGACIGSGLEIFAAAGRRIAHDDCWFQLPEISMGLIPGAGGTLTVPNAIGRHRAGWMMLTGKRIAAPLAIKWGLAARN